MIAFKNQRVDRWITALHNHIGSVQINAIVGAPAPAGET
jgi:hypothetical protein